MFTRKHLSIVVAALVVFSGLAWSMNRHAPSGPNTIHMAINTSVDWEQVTADAFKSMMDHSLLGKTSVAPNNAEPICVGKEESLLSPDTYHIDGDYISSDPCDCWSKDCFDCGDSNGDCLLTTIDLFAYLYAAENGYDRCVDFNKDYVITTGDYYILMNNWDTGCSNCGNCTTASTDSRKEKNLTLSNDSFSIDRSSITNDPNDPNCWSNDCFDCGDSNGDCLLTTVDLYTVLNTLEYGYNPCADFNKDFVITTGDYYILMNNWEIGCSNCGSCTPVD